jgi:hypothetical protein
MGWDTASAEEILAEVQSWAEHIYNDTRKYQPVLISEGLAARVRKECGDDLVDDWIKQGSIMVNDSVAP